MVFSIGGGPGNTEETRLLWRLAGLGIQFGTEIIAGVLLGWLVDRTFGTAPWGVLIGAIAGILVAMTHFLRQAMRLNREMERAASVRTRVKPAAGSPIRPDLAEMEFPEDEEKLTHEQWKALRDRELEPNPKRDEG